MVAIGGVFLIYVLGVAWGYKRDLHVRPTKEMAMPGRFRQRLHRLFSAGRTASEHPEPKR